MKTKVFDQLDYKKKKYLKALFFLLLYLICAIGYTFFTFRSNIAQGADDLYFHAGRAVGLESILQSPINFKTYGAVGFPINIFYGWITIYPMYFLISVLGQVVIGYNVYFVLLTFTTFLICHFSFTKLINSSFAGCIFSLSYTFSAYRAMDVFSRAAVGEVFHYHCFHWFFVLFTCSLLKRTTHGNY